MEYFKKDAQEKKKKKRQSSQMEDEETMTYMQRKRAAFLNAPTTVFKGLGEDSFHLAPSVFDRQAIFHTTDDQK